MCRPMRQSDRVQRPPRPDHGIGDPREFKRHGDITKAVVAVGSWKPPNSQLQDAVETISDGVPE